jgi:hypothetical protein
VLRALVLTRVPRRQTGTRPDSRELFRCLAAHGIDAEVADLSPWPLNPLRGRHSLLESLDPYRAVKVLLNRRRYDVLLAFGEGPAALLIPWRRLLPPILVWDISPDEDWQLRKRLQDYVLPRVAGVLSIHSAQAPYIANRWGIPAWTVGFSVDTTFYSPMPTLSLEYILSVGEDAGRDFSTLILATANEPLVIKTSQPIHHPGFPRLQVISDHLSFPEFRDLYARAHFVVLPLKPYPTNASASLCWRRHSPWAKRSSRAIRIACAIT